MEIRVGYELIYDCPQPTPMILMLSVHSSRAYDIIVPDRMTTTPDVPIAMYRDSFGNKCTRIVAPAGQIKISATGIVKDSGQTDVVAPNARQVPVQNLPEDVLVYLLGSRYCETDHLMQTAWYLFGHLQPGWGMVQAICDFVNNHIRFDYQLARCTRSAWDAYNERVGVCRDYAHLALTLCRCMNIPARYCTGYLGDIGVPVNGPMDFSGWFEAYLDGKWYTFDPRNNIPRIGRILIATGRDATDVPISNTFGPNILVSFKVWTDEIVSSQTSTAAA